MSWEEWFKHSDPTTVIGYILGPSGLLALGIMFFRKLIHPEPSPEDQAKATEAVAAPSNDRDALWIARQALEASADSQEQMKELRVKIDRVSGNYVRLLAWAKDIRGRWVQVRLSETAPELPDLEDVEVELL